MESPQSSPPVGPIHLPIHGQDTTPIHRRIHYLDNLRAVLTILLIVQHAVMEVAQVAMNHPWSPRDSTPLALFVNVNKTFLWPLFFFVAGYSTHLSLGEKGADAKFLVSRSIKIGIPAFLWVSMGRYLLYSCLNSLGLEDVFDSHHEYVAQTRLAGPVGFVIGLMILDYIHLSLRWIGRRALPLKRVSSQFFEQITSSRTSFIVFLACTADIYIIFTFLSCLGVRFFPSRFYHNFVYDIREYPATPAPFVMAYIAGVSFDATKKYLSFNLRASIGVLVGSEILAYLSLGLGQYFSQALLDSTRFRNRYTGPIFFIDPGFNAHTIFYTLWSTFVLYAISISLVSVFTQSHLTSKNWGYWTRHTHVQTYIHMVPIVLAIHYIPYAGVLKGAVVRSILVAFIGVAGSWAISFIPIVWRVAIAFANSPRGPV